ncbi:MAG: hypothetical protein SGARI_000741 [Bacillariaceae sp.]
MKAQQPTDDAVEADDSIGQPSVDPHPAEQTSQTQAPISEQEANRQNTQAHQNPLHVVNDDFDDDASDQDVPDEEDDDGLDDIEEEWPEEEDFLGDEAGVDRGNARPRGAQAPGIFDAADPLIPDDQVVLAFV